MKRILAVADTHLRGWKLPEKLLKMMEDADIVVHAGDFESYEVYRKFSGYELYAVYGNSDDEAVRQELEEVTFEVEGVSFGLIHKGNFINQFHDLGYKAMELGVDVLIFGHLHRFILEEVKGKLLICPDSPTQPRMSIASCAEIVVDGSKIDVKYHIVQPLFCSMDVYEKLEGCG